MAVAVSATGTATHNAGLATETFTFTVNASDTLAVFFIAQDSATANSISSVIWDFGGTNQTCTLVKAQVCTTASNGSINAYAVVNPTAGTLTLQVVQGLGQGMTAELQSYTGSVTTSVAAACTLAVSAQNSNQNSSLPTITGATGDMDVGAFLSSGTINSINNTQIWLQSAAGKQSAGANASSTGAAITFTLAQSVGVQNAGVGFNIVAAAGGGSGTATSGGAPVDAPVTFSRKTIFQTLAFVPVVTTPTLIWNAWTQWPDFATKARPAADMLPWRFLEPAPQVFYPFDRWPDSATKAKPPAEFQSLALVVPLQPTAWTQWSPWPDIVPFRAKPAVDFKPWSFIPPPAQVFYPYDRWADLAWAAKRVAQNPDWSYGTFVTPTAATTWNAWTQWPDFATRAKPVADFIPWTFIPPAAQVFYPFDRWPDSATKAKPVAQNQEWAYGTFVTPTFIPTYTQWTQWPDFLLRAKSVPDFKPWSFVPPPFQVFYPFDRWPDSATKAKPSADFPFESLVVPLQPTAWTQWAQWPDFATKAKPTAEFFPWRFVEPPPQVWFPPGNWDDFTRRKFVQVDTGPWVGPYVTTAPVITWNAWTDWPDFAPRAKAVPEFFPWRFIPPAKQVWFPHDAWLDIVRKKPVPLNYVPLTYVNTATIKTPWVTMTTWPDFAPIKGKPGLPPQLQEFLIRNTLIVPLPTVSATMFAIGVTSDGAIFAINVTPNPNTGSSAATALVSIQEIGHI